MSHPYKDLPDYAFWRRSVVECNEVNPAVSPSFSLRPHEKVATAGSCFAQHIARHLKKRGFSYYIAEPAHPIMSEDVARTFNYGTFSCRYGNVYTSLQLKQLIERVYGEFVPHESAWQLETGLWVDPFRPQIQPRGFISVDELERDRSQHFASVRHMLSSMDVFIFTLGLTECWVSRSDGSVFPICPGVSGGKFDHEAYRFQNLTVREIVTDMSWVIDRLRAIRPGLKILLTVSPVPLMATAAGGRHVLSATTYSKSVLRVAAEELCEAQDMVDYFPSYEIITGPNARGSYFASDLRSVTENGVDHVMRAFIRSYTDQKADAEMVNVSTQREDDHVEKMEAIIQTNCDEQALDPLVLRTL